MDATIRAALVEKNWHDVTAQAGMTTAAAWSSETATDLPPNSMLVMYGDGAVYAFASSRGDGQYDVLRELSAIQAASWIRDGKI